VAAPQECAVLTCRSPSAVNTRVPYSLTSSGYGTRRVRGGNRRPGAAAWVLTNTRSLTAADAAARNRQVVRALAEAARAEGMEYVLASRGDSTLRGHFPLETDVLAAETGSVDGVVLVPAYVEAGRLTIDSTHWMRTEDGMLPVGRSEFARDATFGYRSSDLRDWVAEKTGGRTPADEVLTITLDELRRGGPTHVAGLLETLTGERPAVVDAVCDDDLRVLALAVARAEARGLRLIYRVGPSFVRARAGQGAREPLTASELRRISRRRDGTSPYALVPDRQGRHHLQRHRHRQPPHPPRDHTRHAAARHRLAVGARRRAVRGKAVRSLPGQRGGRPVAGRRRRQVEGRRVRSRAGDGPVRSSSGRPAR
jgi:hypothetical protein